MGASTNPPNICIVMEYMPLGSLYKILHDESVKLELEMIRKMMLDAARGMNYLHKSNPVIIHRY
jgi:serine/threonine protein kinase